MEKTLLIGYIVAWGVGAVFLLYNLVVYKQKKREARRERLHQLWLRELRIRVSLANRRGEES